LKGLDLTRLDIPFASKWQVGAQAIFDQDLSNGAGMTGAYRTHPFATQLESRTLLDASVTCTSPDQRYYLPAFAKNLLNEKYRVSANSAAEFWNFTMYSAPLRWGVEFGMSFQ
jgi:outer membrane receptor protein involved in Fe transport